MLDLRANNIEYQGQTELIDQLSKLVDGKRLGKPQKKAWVKLIKAARYLDVVSLKDNFEYTQLKPLTFIYECLISALNINRIPVSPAVGLIETPTVVIGIPGPPGPAGISSYLYFAWADNASGTGFTTTYNTDKTYLAFIQSSLPILVLTSAMFAGRWFRILGQDGADGVDGTNGTNGTNGIDGRTILNGTVNPGDGVGSNGDFYINTATNMLFGPKASGTWPAGVSLVGPTGAAGSNGVNGATILSGVGAPLNGNGANGDFYINLSTYEFYGPKAGGVWPAGVSLVGPAGASGPTGAAGAAGTNGTDGTNSFVYIAYADAPSGSGYILVQSNDSSAVLSPFDQTKAWIGIVTSASSLAGTISASTFATSWAKYQGDGDKWRTYSTTSLTIATGIQILTVEQGLAYSTGQAIVIANPSDFTERMEGFVVNYNPGTGIMVTSISNIFGTGTLASWDVNLQAFATDPPSTYGGDSPSTVAVNDLPAGTSITGLTYDYLFERIFAPFVFPTFSAFAMSGQATTVEVGTSMSGSKTFTWTTVTPLNVEPNSIDILDVTGAATLATGLADDSTESGIAIGTVSLTSPGAYTWRIQADYKSPQVGSFTRDFIVNWMWKKYSGTSTNATLTETQIEALVTNSLSTSLTGTYSFAAGGYKYFSWPDSFGSPTAAIGFRDSSTNLSVSMADSSDDASFSNVQNGWSYAIVSVTNVNGQTTNYRLYRTKFILGAAIDIIVS